MYAKASLPSRLKPCEKNLFQSKSKALSFIQKEFKKDCKDTV